VLDNLQHSFPEKDLKEIIKIAKGVYRHFAIVAAEFFSLPSIARENIHRWVELEGLKIISRQLPKVKEFFSSLLILAIGS